MSVYSAPHVQETPRPLRRLRHAEVVIVDDVCLAFGKYWLRLRWPGHKGGFAGYLPLSVDADGGLGKQR